MENIWHNSNTIKGMSIHHDQDTVFTGYRWLRQVIIKDGLQISFARRGAKDNTAMESFNSHFKGEVQSLFLDASSLKELRNIIEGRIRYYNKEGLHSILDYKTLADYIKTIKGERK